MPHHFFAGDRQERNIRCIQKDAIVEEVVSKLQIRRGFSAVLMPARHGPEVELLEERGVPLKHMFAIERDPMIRKMQLERGLLVPPKAMAADRAVDHIPFERADFCYLDFLGRPSTSHLETIRKIMRLGLVQRGCCLLVTLGVNRGNQFSCRMATSDGQVHGSAYVRAAVSWARGLQPKEIIGHEYLSQHGSHVAKFLTTEVWF